MRGSKKQGKLTLSSLSSLELDDTTRVALSAAIIESSDDGIVCKTLDGRIRSWNAGAQRLFGYSADEAVGESILMLIPPELQAEEEMILSRIRSGERVEHFDTTRLTKDGRHIPVSLTVSPVRNAAGEVIGASKIARDISERKNAERTLFESGKRIAAEANALAKLNEFGSRLWRCRQLEAGLQEVLDAMIASIGADLGSIQLLDYARMESSFVAQRGFRNDFFEPFTKVFTDDSSARARALRTKRTVTIEDVEKDAAYRPFLPVAREAGFRAVIAIPLLDVDEVPFAIVAMQFREPHAFVLQELRRIELYSRLACDFILRCKSEQRLRESEDALRLADKRKDEFLALLAHELRNPLAPIRYAVAAYKRGGQTSEQLKRTGEIIDRQVTHMSRLLDDLLDVSRITRGTLELKKTATELSEILNTAIEGARPLIEIKQHQLTVDVPKESMRLMADPARLIQVFSNLLINAAKYTDPHGRINLSAQQRDGELIVTVSDNGIGIGAEELPNIFTLFTQSPEALERSEGGMGVGLALVRGLVQLHGGDIDAQSAGANQGSKFTVRLPVITAPKEQIESVRPPSLQEQRGIKVLVVDDNKDAAETCKMLLELSGHSVEVAYVGAEALKVAEEFKPSVCLLDIGLPDMTGYDIARRFRARPWGKNAFLVAISGWGQAEDRKLSAEAGFDEHLTKPVPEDTLNGLLQSLFERSQ